MPRAPLPTGKLPPALLRELLEVDDPPPPELRVGPALGEDGAAIEVAGGVLIAATDPVTMMGSDVGRHAVIINANDVAVMGVAPRWFLAAVLLPEGTNEGDVRALFAGLREALAGLGASLVGGHTEITAAVRQTVVVGQMLGLAEDGRFVRTGGVRPGDVVLQVGAAPVEGAAVLAAEAGGALAGVDPRWLAAARAAVEDPGISVVAPALEAARLGATALHDPTEGGLATGLYELAEASGLALCGVDDAAICWFEPGRVLCEAVGADPWGTLASGALLASFAPGDVAGARQQLGRLGRPCAEIARAEAGQGVWRPGGSPLQRFERDELSRVL